MKAQGTGLGVKLALFDVDGVLTDGRIYIGEGGEAVKAFSTLDGHGLKSLQQVGITPVVITGRDSPAVRRRVADLGLTHALYGISDKLAAAEPLLARMGASWGRSGRHRRRLARPAAADPRRLCQRATRRPCRSAGRRPPHHSRCCRLRCGARVLRPAADGRRPLRATAARPPPHAGTGASFESGAAGAHTAARAPAPPSPGCGARRACWPTTCRWC